MSAPGSRPLAPSNSHTLTTRGVYAYARPYVDENAVVLVNFSSVSRTVTVDPGSHLPMSLPGPIPYYDIFADTSAAYPGAFDVTVPPYETVIYITSEDPGYETPSLPPLPYGAVYTAAEREELPVSVKLSRNYPNPFNPETTIEYTLPRAETVRLVVYDLLGREVARLVDGLRPAGRHQIRFRAGELPSGTYVYRLETAGERHTQTMVSGEVKDERLGNAGTLYMTPVEKKYGTGVDSVCLDSELST